MDTNIIIKQSTDMCVNQILYTEFGLKQSEKTSYLIFTTNIIRHLLKNYGGESALEQEEMIALLNKINIKYG